MPKRKAKANLKDPEEKRMKLTVKQEVHVKLTDLYQRVTISSDGNCLFAAIQFCLTGSQENSQVLRKEVCQYMEEHQDEFEGLFEPTQRITNLKEYIKVMRQEGVWGNHLELSILAELYQFNTIIFNSNSLIVKYRLVDDSPQSFRHRTFDLEYMNGNHYNVLLPRSSAKVFAELERRQMERDQNNSFNQTKITAPFPKISIKLSPQGTKKKVQGLKKNNSEVIVDQMIPLQKDHVMKKAERDDNDDGDIYPLAKGKHNAYNEAFKFFRYQDYPERVKSKESRKYWKDEIGRRYKLINKCNNQFSKSRLQIKDEGGYKTIPYKEEIRKLVETAHNGFETSKVRHNGIRMTLKNLKSPSMMLYWANMSVDVRKYIEICPDCVHIQPVKQKKVYKIIIPKGPYDRFTADIYQLTETMISESDTYYKYILSCVDHFSKYRWCELIPNKEATTIVKKLELFFNFYRPPSIFQTDNGREFKNELVNNLCTKKNIKVCHGRPYYPQSQGVIEKINDLISRSLHSSLYAYQNKKRDNDGEKWDLEGSLKAYVLSANRNVHTVTKMIPLIAINFQKKEDIELVQENIKNYYSKKQTVKEEDFKVGTKVFIIEEVRKKINKNQLITASKNKKKKSNKQKGRIPAEVTGITMLDQCKVEVKIYSKSYLDIKLDKSYLININYLEIVHSIQSWNALVIN